MLKGRIKGIHEAAVILGREGGKARAKNLTAEKRKKIAINAAKVRWSKKKNIST